ncbi:unnamed protein product [Calypogeia fissa]
MSKSNTLMGSKRRRGAEDEVYFDNYHNHKRYLTEVMASSMNGLSVSDAAANNKRPTSPLVDPMLSPAATETLCTLSRSASSFPSQGDETSTLDSFMSEESDESVGYRFSRGSEAPQYTAPVSTELASGHAPSASSPSPRRFQRLQCHGSGQVLPGSVAWMSTTRIPMTPYTPSWSRFPDSDGRLPPSPNDPSNAPDLRRATLLRNLSMRAQVPTQPTSSSTTPDTKPPSKSLEEQESVEEVGDQSILNPMSCQFYEYAPEQVGCNTAIMGSPTHGVFPGHVVRGSPRVRSLVLGEEKIRPKVTLLDAEVATSNEGDELMAKGDQPSEEDVLYNSSSSPLSPGSLNTAAGSSGYEISSCLSPKDGNVSDTESSFSRRSVRTSLSRQPSVCSHADSSFTGREGTRPTHPPTRIT